jgi:hypothetical protein
VHEQTQEIEVERTQLQVEDRTDFLRGDALGIGSAAEDQGHGHRAHDGGDRAGLVDERTRQRAEREDLVALGSEAADLQRTREHALVDRLDVDGKAQSLSPVGGDCRSGHWTEEQDRYHHEPKQGCE